MRSIRFLFVGEGPVDDALIPHLENLIISCGLDEVRGIQIDWQYLGKKPSHAVGERIRDALSLEPNVDFIFVHRDADDADPRPRLERIRTAFQEIGLEIPSVPIVPVQDKRLLEELDPEGEIKKVPAWQRMKEDLLDALAETGA